eukprot:9747390-Lingulodinium_polyedra.AAC.1
MAITFLLGVLCGRRMRRPIRGPSVPTEDRDAPASADLGGGSSTDDARRDAPPERVSPTGDGASEGARASTGSSAADPPARAN